MLSNERHRQIISYLEQKNTVTVPRRAGAVRVQYAVIFQNWKRKAL